MGYGLGIFLLALGLILAFAVRDAISGVDLTMVGYILAAVGALAIVLTAVTANPRVERTTSAPRRTRTAPRPRPKTTTGSIPPDTAELTGLAEETPRTAANSAQRPPPSGQGLVHLDVPLAHRLSGESRGLPTALVGVDLGDPLGGLAHLVDVVADEPGDAVLDHLGHRTAPQRDDGGAGGQGLDHHQAERLGPVAGEERGPRAGVELGLLVLLDLPDEVDVRGPCGA